MSKDVDAMQEEVKEKLTKQHMFMVYSCYQQVFLKTTRS